MKKFFGYVIIISLLFSFILSCEAKPKKKKAISTRHKIEFVTRDKYILVGDLYLATPQTDKPLIVCLHSFSLNARVWSDLAKNLRLKGYNVLAMDLRGHGRSVYNENLRLKSRFYFETKDWQKLPKDVVDSIKYVKLNYPKINCDDVVILGADIGANAGAIASLSFKNPPKKMIFISPMIEFKGLRMPVRTNKFYDTKIFMLLSKTDRIIMNFETKQKPQFKRYKAGGPGNSLLKVNNEANDDIVKFIIN